jgi:uncharacterized protein YndB with AHSA1/START domain
MDERKDSEINPTKYGTTVERKSERELVVTRTFNGPAHIVFDAWTKPELLKRWWAPKSFWGVLPFLRGRCSYGGHVPFRVQSRFLGAAYVILW